jgi:acyl-CoA thioesterase-1
MIPFLLLLGLMLPPLATGGTPGGAPLPAAAPEPLGPEGSAPPVILIVGDSLSAAYGIDHRDGWVKLLEDRLREKGLPHRIINASVSGETTAGGRARLPRLLEEYRPALMVLELGANDGLRGFGFGVIHDNLTAMIHLARDAGSQILLAGIRLPPNYGAAYTDRFQAVFREVAAAEGVPLVPDFLAGIPEDRALMQADDLHPNAEAQPRILDNVWPLLEPLLGKEANSQASTRAG